MYKLTPLAETILLEKGIVKEGEEFSSVLRRIARNIASAEPAEKRDEWEEKFYNIMANNYFLPNFPTLTNGSREDGQITGVLSACSVLDIEDSRESIFNVLKDAVEIQASGCGTGFDFSNLRENGSEVTKTNGVASGPISFMEVYNLAIGDKIMQGSRRKGASMGSLHYSHPDILDFITVKKDRSKLKNFNLSVLVDDYFMEKAKNGEAIQLVSRKTGEVVKEVNASILLDEIAKGAIENGCPGVLFFDAANKNNPFKKPLHATNPCGETFLYSLELCVLGSINLKQLKLDGNLTDEYLGELIRTCVRFLDNIIDLSYYPLDGMKEIAKKNRKIGLGCMGVADILLMEKLSYASEEARDYVGDLYRKVQEYSVKASEDLASEKEPFESFEESNIPTPRRNSYITLQAPTGTLSLLADCSPGIEPVFSWIQYMATSKSKNRHKMIHPLLVSALKKKKLYSEDLLEQIEKNRGSINGIKSIPKEIQEIFVTALDINYVDHVRMQASVQKYLDNSVSKTINMHKECTAEDAKNAIILAHNLGCKGVTIYRDGTKEDQPLKYSDDKKIEKPSISKKRPKILSGETEKISLGSCGSLLVTINKDIQSIKELIISKGSSGSCTNALMEGMAKIISKASQYGTPIDEIIKQLDNIKCDMVCWDTAEGEEKPDKITSCPNAISVSLKRYIKRNGIGNPIVTNSEAKKCPQCGNDVIKDGSCEYCTCGYSKC